MWGRTRSRTSSRSRASRICSRWIFRRTRSPTRLQYLQLDRNQVSKLDGLKDLKKLMALYLEKNKVQSIKPLAGLSKLASLYLADNQISDLSPLKGLKWIQVLDLRNNKIKTVSAMSAMTDLRYTMLQGNQISDISPLVKMAAKDAAGERRFAPYWHLYLANNPLSDKSKSVHVAAIKKIGVRLSLKSAN